MIFITGDTHATIDIDKIKKMDNKQLQLFIIH